MRIRIIAVPPEEAPAWVREKWVGLELPLARWSSSPIAGGTYGVLPRSFFGMSSATPRRQSGNYYRLPRVRPLLLIF